MVGIYLLVTLLAQISSGAPWGVAAHPVAPRTEVVVNVEKLNGVRVGAPVFVAGNKVGTVARVHVDATAPAAPAKREDNGGAFALDLSISSEFRNMLKSGTVAVIAPTMTVSQSRPQVVVELFVPPNSGEQLKDGAKIRGYTSYEKFWADGFNKV